jgi:hypothetical protein
MIPRSVYTARSAHIDGTMHLLSKMLAKRRGAWPSRADARTWLGGRLPWKAWDPRVVDLFVVRRERAWAHSGDD